MAFTYTQVIERVRLRSTPLRKKFDGWTTDSVLFTVVVDALRTFIAKTGDYESSASLSIVSGQQDYTISSAIAADVGEIHLITRNASTSNTLSNIEPREIRKWQQESYNATQIDTAWDITPEPFLNPASYFKVYNGVLSLVPTPSSSETVTVYYSPAVSNVAYSLSNMALTVPIKDLYLDSFVDRIVSQMYEISGDPKMSDRLLQNSETKFQEAKAYQPEYGFDNSVIYHDPIL